MDWYQIKLFAQHATGVSTDAWHILLGVLVQLALARLTGRSLSSWLPWTLVLLLELANEFNDLLTEAWPDPGMQYGEGGKDVLLTMLLPTVLLLASRRLPEVLVGSAGDGQVPGAEEGSAQEEEGSGH